MFVFPYSDFPEWVVGGLVGGTGVTLRVTALNARGRSETLRLEVHTASAQHRAAHGTVGTIVCVLKYRRALLSSD